MVALTINVIIVLIAAVAGLIMNDEAMFIMAAAATVPLPFIVIRALGSSDSPEDVAYRKTVEEEKQKDRAAKQAARAAKEAELAAIRAELEARKQAKLYAEGKVILEVKFLGNGATLLKRGGLGDYLWGDFVAGPVGGVIAASAVKSEKQLLCFAVLYSDKHIEIEQVLPNSKRFNELMQYVKWEEIE